MRWGVALWKYLPTVNNSEIHILLSHGSCHSMQSMLAVIDRCLEFYSVEFTLMNMTEKRTTPTNQVNSILSALGSWERNWSVQSQCHLGTLGTKRISMNFVKCHFSWTSFLCFSPSMSAVFYMTAMHKMSHNRAKLWFIPYCGYINPRLTKLFFGNTSNQGGCATPSLDFLNQTPYEISFGINR